ncbi:MAG: ABC transporter ATP-binding protein [Lachnospiraceae bacterium]|nr:ABC transporter ATP-binding protein [Lachnospiraceae bacterium]
MSNYSIVADNICFSYKKKQALNNLSFSLNENEIIGLIGANGSGKTTFFNICNGSLIPKSGKLTILGEKPNNNIALNGELIYSNSTLTVGEHYKLKQILDFYNITYPHFDKEFANKLLDLFKLSNKSTVASLSKGKKSLLHLICALSTRAKITCLDEPFIGIDIESRKLCYEIILRDFIEYPRTFIISSHNLTEIEGLLSEIILIDDGSTIFYEDIDTVREMMFRADGDNIENYISEDIIIKKTGELGNYLIAKGSINSKLAQEMSADGFKISPVSPEDLCIYLTTKNKESDLECLWQ